MCCNGIIVILALVIGFAAIIYLLYQTYSYIKCGCGQYGPFVSSYGKIKEDMIEEARAVLKKAKHKMKVTDLGCGSGALLLPLAKEFPEHEFIGYEWDIVPLTMGKIKAAGLKNISFIKGDYMKQDYHDMDLIMCYVLKVTGEPLGKILAESIKDSCIVISEMFPLGHLEEIKQIDSSIYGVPEKIFVYKKPQTDKKASTKDKAEKKSPVKSKGLKAKTMTKTKASSKTVSSKVASSKTAKATVKGGKNVKKK